jgi:hypothetical protein
MKCPLPCGTFAKACGKCSLTLSSHQHQQECSSSGFVLRRRCSAPSSFLPEVYSRKFQTCCSEEVVVGTLNSSSESPRGCTVMREKPATRTLGCRTCDPEELLVDPGCRPPVRDTSGGRSRAGLGGKVAAAVCVTARTRVCSVTAARKAHLGAKPLLSWSCHI